MYTDEKRKYIKELAQDIKDAGFEVYLSYNGEYGFFTDSEGKKVVCFQLDLFTLKFGGNTSPGTRQTGTGWRSEADNFLDAWKEPIPEWLSKLTNERLRFTTKDEYLSKYGSSSKFKKF